MSVIIELANAVVAHLNSGLFGQAFTAQRQYLPLFDLPEMATLHVTVVPKGMAISALDRLRDNYDFDIDVAVQQKTDGSPDQLDPLMTLVEQIADSFRTPKLATYPAARCTAVKNVPVYAQEHLHEMRQFTSVLTLTFRVPR